MKKFRAKVSDFAHGKTFYYVNVGYGQGKIDATIKEKMALGSHRKKHIIGGFYVGCVESLVSFHPIWARETTETYIATSCPRDYATPWHQGRSLHRVFRKKKHAEAYAARINRGCLSAAERKHFDISKRLSRAY